MERRVPKGLLLGLVGATLVYRRVVRPWHERWGATEEESSTVLPGDDLIAEPAFQITRAIAIDAPPEAVWSWVVQIGAERGGFYSYDGIENLFGLDIHNADEIVPEWQNRSVGDLMCADGDRSGGWYVMDVRPGEALVVKMANVEKGRPFTRDELPFTEFTWAFALREQSDGSTRFLVRERVAFGNKLARVLASPIGLISFVMTQKMMRGIKERAERAAAAPAQEAPPVHAHG